MSRYAIGQPAHRVEDRRFLTGRGEYLDDLEMPDMLHAAFVRSPIAHGHIRRIDSVAALKRDGVVAVITAEDWQASGLGALPCNATLKGTDGAAMARPLRPVLAQQRVRHVGECVAMVVATSSRAAHDAACEVEVDYDSLPAVVDAQAALAPGAPQLWPEAPGNLCVDWSIGDKAATDSAMAGARHVVSLAMVNNRIVATPLEPRAAIGAYDADSDSYRLIGSIQNVFQFRRILAEHVLRIEPGRLQVTARDVGGSFGAKNPVQPEHALVLFAARKLRRPVKWVSERSEAFVSDAQGRGHLTHAELGLDGEGRFLALRQSTVAELGASLSLNGPHIPTVAAAAVLGGGYEIQCIHAAVRCVFTNTVPTDAYRGSGRPESTYVIERLVDVAAAALDVDRVALRRRNLIRSFPHRTALGRSVDSGAFGVVMDKALAAAGHASFPDRAMEARERGRRRGLGVSFYLEATLGTPQEYARLAFAADGTALLSIGTHSTGQGHETAFLQIVADRLGIPFTRIRFRQADTSFTALGGGHGGSRSLHLGGAAILGACARVIEKARLVAGHLLEAAPVDIEFAAGRFTVAGTDRHIEIADVIAVATDPGRLPPGIEPGLDEHAVYDREANAYPNGCHVAEVEVDPETGAVAVERYTVCDDFGRVINPLIVRGQVMGGVAQGIGQALHEHVVYDDETGQLLTGTLMDYALPRADDLPSMLVSMYEDAPARTNPLGVKGCGEAGTTAAPPAIVNAVVDALREYGIRHIDMPLTPHRVWQAIRTAAPGQKISKPSS